MCASLVALAFVASARAQDTAAAPARTIARVQLPGTIAREAWSARYAALGSGRRATEAVPALAPLRAALPRILVHLEALAAASGRAEPWSFAIERMLREPVSAIELRLAWEPSPAGVAIAALSSLRLEVGWIGVREELPREILAAFSARGVADLDPHPARVLLPFGGSDANPAAPRLEWHAPDALWLSLGAPELERRERTTSAAPAAEVAIALDLAQCEAWLDDVLFGRPVAVPTSARMLALEKELLPESVRDRMTWPATSESLSASSGVRYRLRSGWLRLAVAPAQRELALGVAALLARVQGEDGAWIEEARAWLERTDTAADARACFGLVAQPTLSSLGLRSALWCASAAIEPRELAARGYREVGGLWVRDGVHLRSSSRGWTLAPRAEEALAISAELEEAEASAVSADWIGELEVETYELYSAARLALLARRAEVPSWLRGWIEGLPSPRSCGALLAPASWTLRQAAGARSVEGVGPLGDPLLSLVELLLARAAARGFEVWLRDLAEPEHARRTVAAMQAAALELRRRWQADPNADLRALDRNAAGPLGWRSPMDLEEAPRPAFRIARVEDLPASLRAALGLDAGSATCPWVLVEERAWYAGGTQRHCAACAGDLPTVLASSLLEAPSASGR